MARYDSTAGQYALLIVPNNVGLIHLSATCQANSTCMMQVSTSNPNNQSTAQTLTDGDWHMFTLTTNARGIRGYNIFMDGQLVGTMKPNNTYTSTQGSAYVACLCQ
jgi:hypothetical protein